MADRVLRLCRRARQQENLAALQFILVNETHALTPYQIACLWVEDQGLAVQSGVSVIDHHGAFAQWFKTLGSRLPTASGPVVISAAMLDPQDLDRWAEAFPAHALWLPLPRGHALWDGHAAGLLVCRTHAWREGEVAALTEWCDAWWHAAESLTQVTVNRGGTARQISVWAKRLPSPQDILGWGHDIATGARFARHRAARRLSPAMLPRSLRHWYLRLLKKPTGVGWFVLMLLIACLPVNLTVLAPGSLVPLNPAVVRVPIDGVINSFTVTPNQSVHQGQQLFELDRTALLNRLQQAEQAMGLASAEYRQGSLQSLTDVRSRNALASNKGHISERQVEVDFLRSQLEKTRISAPRDGIALLDDPTEWLGRPVTTGEKVMMVAWPDQVEVEVWLPVSDAIALEPNAQVSLFLNTSPMSPVTARLRYLSMEAQPRPDGSLAFRLRATPETSNTGLRTGLRGTARVSGDTVPLLYWVLRKPLAALRQWVGL